MTLQAGHSFTFLSHFYFSPNVNINSSMNHCQSFHSGRTQHGHSFAHSLCHWITVFAISQYLTLLATIQIVPINHSSQRTSSHIITPRNAYNTYDQQVAVHHPTSGKPTYDDTEKSIKMDRPLWYNQPPT